MSEQDEPLGDLPGALFLFRTLGFNWLPKSGDGDAWDPEAEVAKRLDALDLLEETLEGMGLNFPKGGSRGFDGLEEELEQARQVFRHFRVKLIQLQDAAKVWSEFMSETGIELDPDTPGGGRLRTGRPGPSPSLLSRHVKDLLRVRFPNWDGSSPLPAENNQELRDWVHLQLTRNGEWQWHPAEEVDPSSGGPLFVIIKNLQRLR